MNRGYSVQISRVLLVLFVCLLCDGDLFAENVDIQRIAVLDFTAINIDE